jgi:hypothetical protein
MEQIPCLYCGDFFDPSPRHKNQTACKKVKCQRAKKAAWQRHKLKTDPIYAANQKSSQQQWIKANPGYWKQYRQNNPQKAERQPNWSSAAQPQGEIFSGCNRCGSNADCKDGCVKIR